MAKSSNIDLNVTLKTKLENVKANYAENKAGMTSQKQLDVERKIRALENAISVGIDNLSKRELRSLSSAFKAVNEEIVKVISANVKFSQKTREAEEALRKAREAQSKYTEKIQNAKSKGKMTDNGFELYDTVVKKMLKEAEIQRKDGKNLGWSAYSKYAKASTEEERLEERQSLVKVLTDEGIKQLDEFAAKIKKVSDTAKNTLLESTKKDESGLTKAEQLQLDIENKTQAYNKQVEQDTTEVVSAKIQEIDSQSAEIDKLIVDEIDSRNAIKEQTEETTNVEGPDLKGITKANDKATSSLGRAFKNFTIYRAILGTVKKAAKEAANTIRELDKSLTEQAMVTGKTREQTYALLSQYQDMALSLGATSKEVAEVATQFMRQGKTVADSLKLTTAAISAAKVAGISAADSVNYLTTALNGFQMSAEQSMSVSDKFAAIAANSASSYEEIAIAMSKVASQANLAGMSIDYTTALLAKGLETTREAPETIGTALKTVIARMREITDYGATLEGDTDVNNVETQLAYVGIALKTTNGELRSTEDVLDELGKKWDTLSTNQQAAVAKALAGTRQQSRLIAMMTDYDRVIELQEISLRSAGATSAQAAVYLQGLEAAVNKVSVAWEKIVSAFSDNKVIIGFVDVFGSLLDNIGAALENSFVMVGVIGAIATLSATTLGNKIRELIINKQIAQLELQEQISIKKAQILKQKGNVAAKQQLKIKAEQLVKEKEELLTVAKKALIEAKSTGNAAAIASAQQDVLNAKKELAAAEEDLASYEFEENKLNIFESQLHTLEAQTSVFGSLKEGVLGLVMPFSMVFNLLKLTIAGIKQATNETEKASRKAKGALVDQSAWSASNLPGIGWLIAGAILATGVAALSIATLTEAFNQTKKAEKAAHEISSLSNEIYTLTQTSSKIDTAVFKFDELDKKVIKTKEDLEEMKSILEGVGDALPSDKQSIFNSLNTAESKKDYLSTVQKEINSQIEKDRLKQISLINRNSSLLSSDSESAIIAKDALYALNNASLYNVIDDSDLGDNKSAIQEFAQTLLESVDAFEAMDIATDGTKSKINDLVEVLKTTKNIGEDEDVLGISYITDNTQPLVKRVKEYSVLLEKINSVSNELGESFKKTNSDLEFFTTLSDDTIEYIDKYSISASKINDVNKAFGYSEDALNTFFKELSKGSTIDEAIKKVESFVDSTDNLSNRIANILSKTAENIGQNADSISNEISSFYEKTLKWKDLSESERIEFISSNSGKFENNPNLLKAIESGDHNILQEALLGDEKLNAEIDRQINDLEIAIQAEMARGAEANQALLAIYRKQLNKYKNEREKVFRVSLKEELAQQNEQLEQYKTYLQKQNDALVDSLEKRKAAYEKYFEAVNQMAEDEDYEEERNILISNLEKISSSTDAQSEKQRKDLENQLYEMEKERLQTLRERAQELLTKSIDDKIDITNQKLDDIVENGRKLLEQMTTSFNADNIGILADMLYEGSQGKTSLEIEQLWSDLVDTYGKFISNVDPSSLSSIISSDRENGNLTLNIGGDAYDLTESDQKDLRQTILNALNRLGVSK